MLEPIIAEVINDPEKPSGALDSFKSLVGMGNKKIDATQVNGADDINYNYYTIVVPAGSKTGDVLDIKLGIGLITRIQVPAGVNDGDILTISTKKITAPSAPPKPPPPPDIPVDGEILTLADNTRVGRAMAPSGSKPGDILRINVDGKFHSRVQIVTFAGSDLKIFFDPTERLETDDVEFALDPATINDNDLAPKPPADPSGFVHRSGAADPSGFVPRSGAADPDGLISGLSDGSESPASSQDSWGHGGKKTKTTKKSKKKTRKYHKIISQVKKLLKEV